MIEMRCCFSKCCSNVVQMMLFVEIYKISIQINLNIWNQKSYSESEEVSSVMAGREIIIINIQVLSPKSFRQFTNRMELLLKTFIDCGTGYQMFTHSFIGGKFSQVFAVIFHWGKNSTHDKDFSDEQCGLWRSS